MGDSDRIYDDAAPPELKIAAAWCNYNASLHFEELPDYRAEERLSIGVSRYISDDYKAINSYLNNPEAGFTHIYLKAEDIREIVAEILHDMRSLSHSIVVFRGINSIRNPDVYVPGRSINATAFTSTSISREVGVRFATGEYFMQLRIPRAIPVIITNKREYEVILPPGARINFTSQYHNARFPYIESGTGNLTWTSIKNVLVGDVDMGG